MIESQRDNHEFHFTILSVKMKVKFPCRMRIQHQGTPITGETSMTQDSRYVFNHPFSLKDDPNNDCFQLTINLVTEKGAKYIAGAAKLYQSELVRSEGERLVIPLTKCIDTEAFCEIKVDQILSTKVIKNAPYDRKSTLVREIPTRQRDYDLDFSPHRSAYQVKIQESKSQYQFPLHQNGRNNKNDWQTKSKSRYIAPQTQLKPRQTPRMNGFQQPLHDFNGQESAYNRQKMMQAEVYKEGYQKLKEKYRKQAELNKQQLNRRLALENSENNLKLQLMRLKLKNQQLQKAVSDKNNKIKELQNVTTILQQKESQNASLKEENSKKQQNIRILEDRVRALNRNIEELKDLTAQKTVQESNRVRELQIELENLKSRFENRQRQLERQLKTRIQQLHQKQIQLVSKTDNLERQRKTVADLQRTLQLKNSQMEKLIQNEKNNARTKLEEQKLRHQQVEKQLYRTEDGKKEVVRQLEQLRSTFVKQEYEKKILSQELESIKTEYSQAKNFKQKYAELSREHRSLLEEKAHIERQLEKVINNKESSISDLTKQFQDQLQYYKRINRDLDQKTKTLSNKIIEVEGQLDISKGQQDKFRRNYQSLIKEAADSKQREKTARKALKAKEQQSLTMQTEVATLKQKLKNIEQIYKLEVDKLREQNDKIQIQFENQLDKNEQLKENSNQISMQMNKLKIKLQYAEQKIEKDAINLRDKQNQVESLIKDYEEQISSLEQTISNARLAEKQISNKLQKSELDQIRMEQKIQKLKKDVKILQERCNNSQNNLKQKINEISVLQGQRQTISKKNAQIEAEISTLKSQNVVLSTEKNKLAKMTDLLNQQIKRAKAENNGLNAKLVQRQKQEEELRGALKLQKQEVSKSQLRFTTLKKQFQRSKEVLLDTIHKNLFTLPLSNKQQNKKNTQQLISKKPVQNTISQYCNMISLHAKDIKQSLTKQSDTIKQLERQRDRLQEEIASSNNKYQSTELTLKKQIDQLQLELQKIIEERQIEVNDLTLNIEDLNQKINQLQMIEEELNNQIEEVNFTNNSMKLDFQAVNEQNNKKLVNMRKLNGELQQKIQEHLLTIGQLEQRCTLLEAELDNLQITVENVNESLSKKNKSFQELRQLNYNMEKMLEELKRNKKELTQKVSELQMHLHTQRELNDKNKQLLVEEESKNNQLKGLVNDLMKQKEQSIKKQLEQSQQRIALETQLHEMSRQLQLLKEENDKNLKNLEQQRENNKKMSNSLKQIEIQKKQQKAKNLKTQQKLKQKEKELITKEQSYKKLEVKLEKTIQKLKNDLKQLEQQLESKNASNLEHSKDAGQRIIQLQNTIQKKTSLISTLESKVTELQEWLFGQRQKITQLQEAQASLKAENEQLLMKIHQVESSLKEKQEELNLKEEKLFELSGKLYSSQQKTELRSQESLRNIQYLNREWGNKFDSMVEEYQQRLELIEKERDYFKNLCEEKDHQISKLNSTIKSNQTIQANKRKSYEQKIKRLEDDRLSVLSVKNNEVHRIVEENKGMAEQLKAKESQLRRIVNQLEVARKTITNLDQKSKDYDQKFKGVNKVYQTELQQLKKKDLAFKTYKQSVNNFHWNIEREIKKGIQNFIKNFLDLSEEKNSQRIVQLARGLEKSFVETLSNKPQEK